MKNFLIVGASSGIGRALAETLVETGHHVIGTYRQNPPTELNGSGSYHFLDVLEEQPDFSFLPEQLDGLAYCPGSINLRPFHRIKPQQFVDDYELQVLGAIKVVQAAIPRLKEGSSVITFSTVAVRQGFPFHTQVSTSKGAIEGLTKALAAEYAPKIRFNCIAPSLTVTPLAAKLVGTEEKRQANAARHPMKSLGEPDDIAELAAFLMQDKSKWITGQIIHADGGISTINL